MKVHYLKCEIQYYELVKVGLKKFELRFNDRNFKEGDTLILEEYDYENQKLTGRNIVKKVLYVLTDVERFGLAKGYCIMSIC